MILIAASLGLVGKTVQIPKNPCYGEQETATSLASLKDQEPTDTNEWRSLPSAILSADWGTQGTVTAKQRAPSTNELGMLCL